MRRQMIATGPIRFTRRFTIAPFVCCASLLRRRITLLGPVLGDVTQVDIAFDRVAITFLRFAVSTASRRKKSYRLAGMNRSMAELSRQPLRFAVALDDRLVHGSFG